MKYTLISLIALMGFSACKKEKAADLFISGYIYNNCYDREPYRNGQIRLSRTRAGSYQQQIHIADDSTDANGYFKIYFPREHHANWMILKTGTTGDILEKIPPTENIENIDIFRRVFSTVKVSLNVINPRTAADTLVIEKIDTQTFLNIPGPFTSGHLYTVSNYSSINTVGFNGTIDHITHNFKPNPVSPPIFTEFVIDKYCEDTVNVTININ